MNLPCIFVPRTNVETYARLQPPTLAHLFGADDFGRDIFSRVVWGSQLAVRLGFLSVLIAATGGVWLGLLAGYYGGWVDNLISRLVKVILAFPRVLFAIAVIAILGPSLDNLISALGLFGWPGYARIVRGSVLSARQRDYVEAAQAVGARKPCDDSPYLTGSLFVVGEFSRYNLSIKRYAPPARRRPRRKRAHRYCPPRSRYSGGFCLFRILTPSIQSHLYNLCRNRLGLFSCSRCRMTIRSRAFANSQDHKG